MPILPVLLLIYLLIKSLLNNYKVPLPFIYINMSMFSYLQAQPEQHLLPEKSGLCTCVRVE